MTAAVTTALPAPRRSYTTALATHADDVAAAQRLRWTVFAQEGGALLDPAAAGRSYGDGEFDLSRHAALRPGLVEAGRSCVHPDHRTGTVITALWAGVLRYVLERDVTHLAGCASVPLTDGGATVAGVWEAVRTAHLAPAALRVVPHLPFDVMAPPEPERLVVPPLLRAYLKLGARVCGRPAYDPAFGTADLYVLLAVADIPDRVLARLLGGDR